MKIKNITLLLTTVVSSIMSYEAVAQEAPKMNNEENARIDSLAIAYKRNDKREKQAIETKRFIAFKKERADVKLKAKNASRISGAERKGHSVKQINKTVKAPTQ